MEPEIELLVVVSKDPQTERRAKCLSGTSLRTAVDGQGRGGGDGRGRAHPGDRGDEPAPWLVVCVGQGGCGRGREEAHPQSGQGSQGLSGEGGLGCWQAASRPQTSHP